jgi:hypothetical protein
MNAIYQHITQTFASSYAKICIHYTKFSFPYQVNFFVIVRPCAKKEKLISVERKMALFGFFGISDNKARFKM